MDIFRKYQIDDREDLIYAINDLVAKQPVLSITGVTEALHLIIGYFQKEVDKTDTNSDDYQIIPKFEDTDFIYGERSDGTKIKTLYPNVVRHIRGTYDDAEVLDYLSAIGFIIKGEYVRVIVNSDNNNYVEAQTTIS